MGEDQRETQATETANATHMQSKNRLLKLLLRRRLRESPQPETLRLKFLRIRKSNDGNS